MTLYDTVDSPIGELLLAGDGEALSAVQMNGTPGPGWRRDRAALRGPSEQLLAYFAGALREFDLPLAPRGTPFQHEVWSALREIPFGSTISYAELAAAVGRPHAARAVGAANGSNPIAVVIPCHRVIGASGALTGYGGGLGRKRLLLDLEAGRRTWTLIGADGRPYESPTPGTLGGHRRSKGYGRLDCRAALGWIAKGHYVKHRVFFADEETAVAAGYRPCAVCMPKRYAEWKRQHAA
ncbi:MAG TPA: methylated-DNA--[protein]-cysteine S-methyltransferase [Thermoleophilaceae bacterium]|nr:methylated-DNA--[protein]-cysteine S-methyltransferase [Thermoleophilaceae bacterium]